MTVVAVETFFAILALVAIASVVGAAALRLAAVVSRSARRRWDGLARAVGPNAYAMAWFVAFLATAGSLYFSEVAGFEPCRLCWYQRIAMYPLVPILAVGSWKRDPNVRFYALPPAVVGLGVSIWHYLLETFPSLEGSSSCSIDVPCSAKYVNEFGFVSIPFMAGCGFLLIIALMTFTLRKETT